MSTIFTQVSEFLNDRSLRDRGRCPMLVVSSSENFWADANSKFIGPNQSDDPNNPVYYVRSKESFKPMNQKALEALVRLASQHKPPQWLIGILTRVSPEETSLAHENNAWALEVYKSNIEVVTSVNPNPDVKRSEVVPASPKKVQFADPIQQTAVIIPDDTKVIRQDVPPTPVVQTPIVQLPTVQHQPEVVTPTTPTAPPSSPVKQAPTPTPTPTPTPKHEEPTSVSAVTPTVKMSPPKPSANPPSTRQMPPNNQAISKQSNKQHNQKQVRHAPQEESDEKPEEEKPIVKRPPVQGKMASTGFKVFGYEVSAPLAFALGTAAVAGGFYCWYKFGNTSTKQPAKTPATQAAFAPQSPVFRTYYI